MKSIILLGTFLFGQLVLASEPPENYPVVKGVIRKIDQSAGRVSIKHEEIPNLNMPGMTMSFAVQDQKILNGFAVDDRIVFVVDEIDGEITVLWIEKAPQPNLKTAKIVCTGIAPTSPRTKVEIEIRPDKFSTIRYEFIEGAYPGTAYVNSIGKLKLHKRGEYYIYRNAVGENSTKLVFRKKGDQITHSCFSNYSSSMENTSVECTLE